MPAHRKPTKILQFTGAYAKDPQRAKDRVNEPVPTGSIGEPMDWLTPEQVVVWRVIVEECPRGVLTNADRRALGYMCGAMAKQDANMRVGEYDVKLGAHIFSGLQQIGLTPSSRSKVQTIKTPEGPDAKPTFANV